MTDLGRQIGERAQAAAQPQQDGDPMPVFVLKGRDALAPGTIDYYRRECLRHDLAEQALEVTRAFAEMAAWQRRNWTAVKLPDHAHVPAAEPQPADVSLLDLVRQLREAAQGLGYSEGVGQRTDIDAKKADALFARIAALVAQQPVQAGDGIGNLWWLHRCGYGGSAPEVPDEDACPACLKPGPWRPLLVGGDVVPEGQVFAAPPHPYERGPYQLDGSQACGICGGRRAAAVHRQRDALTPRLRIGRHHGDIVYRQMGEQPDYVADQRVAVFMCPDAEAMAAAYVAMANGGAR